MRYVVKGINSYWGKADLTLHYITILRQAEIASAGIEMNAVLWVGRTSYRRLTGPDFSATN